MPSCPTRRPYPPFAVQPLAMLLDEWRQNTQPLWEIVVTSQTEIRESIMERIIEALKAGTPPWRKPWSSLTNTGFAANVISRRVYTGINPLLLDLTATERGYKSRWW